MGKNKIANAGLFYMIGNVFNKAIALILIPIITRMLSTSEYGILNTYLSWVGILTVFAGLSLGSSYRAALYDFHADLNRYSSTMFTLSFFGSCVLSVVVIGANIIFDFKISIEMLGCALVHSFMSFVIESACIKYMMEFSYIKRTLLLALPNLISAVLSIVFIHFLTSERYWGRIIAFIIVYILFGVIILVSTYKKSFVFVDLVYWKYALTYSLPLIFHSLSMVILQSSDRIMITNLRNASESGIYSLVYNISMAVNVVKASAESVWIPWFTKKLNDGDKITVNRAVRYYVEFLSICVCLIMLIAPEAIKVVAPESYWGGIPLCVPIVIASYIIFLYSISVDLEYYYKKTKSIAINTIIAACINLVLNLFFIPYYGALAAAYTTVVAYGVSFILHYINARKIDSELFSFVIYIPSLLVVGVVSILCIVFTEIFVIRAIVFAIVLIGYMLLFVLSGRKNILKKRGN